MTRLVNRARPRFHGDSSACNPSGNRPADTKWTEDMCACHLAFANTAIASRCSRTSQGPYRLCPPPCYRRRTWQRGQKGIGQRWPTGKIVHHPLALTGILTLLSPGNPRSCCSRTFHLRTCLHRTSPLHPRQLTWSPTCVTSSSVSRARWPGSRRFTNSPLLCAPTTLGHCCCDAHR